MNWNPLLGILALAYGGLVFFIAIKKTPAIWDMAKVRGFRKVLGDKGTEIFFYIWGVLFVALAIWLFVAAPIG